MLFTKYQSQVRILSLGPQGEILADVWSTVDVPTASKFTAKVAGMLEVRRLTKLGYAVEVRTINLKKGVVV